VAGKAWGIFQAIEKLGGLISALESGWIQERVAAAAQLRADRLASRVDVLVGTNQYPDPEPLHVQMKTEEIPTVPGGIRPIVPGRDSEPFEALRRRIEDMAGKRPDTGRVFCACLGDFARYMPRLEFTRRFFRVAGFEVLADRFFTTGVEAAEAALADGATTVVLVGLDDVYPDLGPECCAAMQKGTRPPVVMAAGRPEAWESAEGIDAFVHVRTNVLEALGRLADRVGGGS